MKPYQYLVFSLAMCVAPLSFSSPVLYGNGSGQAASVVVSLPSKSALVGQQEYRGNEVSPQVGEVKLSNVVSNVSEPAALSLLGLGLLLLGSLRRKK